MRVARRRVRFEARDPPASRLLKRSPQCGQAPARVGSSGTSEEQHNWERKRMLRIPPPTSEVTSLAIGHPHRDVALNRHIDLRGELQILGGAKAPAGARSPGTFSPMCEDSRLSSLRYGPPAARTAAKLPAGSPPFVGHGNLPI